MSTKPRISHSDHVCRIGSWYNILLVDVASDIDVEHMKLTGRSHADLLKQFPQGIATLAFVRAGVPVSSSAARGESTRFIKGLGDSLRRTVFVLEDRGTVVQLIQTVIRGINVITRNPKLAVCSSVEDAVGSVAALVEGVPKAQAATDLLRVVAAFRADYPPDRKLAANA